MNQQQNDLDLYLEGIHDFGHLIKRWGAPDILLDLKEFYPVQFNELLISMLEHLPK